MKDYVVNNFKVTYSQLAMGQNLLTWRDLEGWSRERMFEKYPSISPYTYCANNPMKYVDPTGMDVETTEDGLAVIKNTVSEEDAKYIRLTSEGKIDKDYLNQCENNEGNIGKLKEMVNNEKTIQFTLDDKLTYNTENGPVEINMGEIDIENLTGVYSLSTGETGHTGQFQSPTSEINTWGASTDGKTRVIINKNLSKQGKAESAGHELYGHAYLNMKGLPSSHQIDKSFDNNLILKQHIVESQKEIRNYFKNKQ